MIDELKNPVITKNNRISQHNPFTQHDNYRFMQDNIKKEYTSWIDTEEKGKARI